MNIPGHVLYLADIIKSHKLRYGGYDGLAKAIVKANNAETDAFRKRRVDRRKLSDLAEGRQDVKLSVDELIALDVFLTPYGHGLGDNPLFKKERILNTFLENRDVIFLLGSYPKEPEFRDVLSDWDVEAMFEVLRAGYRYRSDIHFDYVKFRADETVGPEPQPWKDVLRRTNVSLCSIGSPTACFASEYMLAQMFGIRAFEESAEANVPFYFMWHHQRVAHIPRSAFSLLPSEPERRRRGNIQVFGKDDRALILPGPARRPYYFISGEVQAARKEYGVVVAQRRDLGQIWMVVAGLTGPSTLAAAQAVTRQLAMSLPGSTAGVPSPVLWAVIEAEIQANPNRHGEQREIGSISIVEGPRLWPTP
jgi:hypothetical protein